MYQKAIVTFIDILGFADLVKNSDYESINRVLAAVNESTSPVILGDDSEKDDCAEVVSFSDSIVRVRKIETETNMDYPSGLLFQELISLVHAQAELIDLNIVIRGSVSIGDIFISEGQVFGPGLVEAYELESKYAKYPRIIIDPKLIHEYKSNKLLKASWHSHEQDIEIVRDLLRQSDDGMWFVDYARALKTELDEPEMYVNFLQRHKEVILAGAENHKALNAILAKYIWMAYYHNSLISRFKDDWFTYNHITRVKLSISSADIPTLQYAEL